MPRVYRSMLSDGDNPRIGRDRKSLGVVVDGKNPDLTVNVDGTVSPHAGGMSVAPSIGALPDHRIPQRLVAKYPRATGKDDLVCWSLGGGPFVDGQMTAALMLLVDNARHGTLQPTRQMTLAEYEAELASTQNNWVEDEA